MIAGMLAGQIPLNAIHVSTGKVVANLGSGANLGNEDNSVKYYIFAFGMLATVAAYYNWKNKQAKEGTK
jgi:hypothetical protein